MSTSMPAFLPDPDAFCFPKAPKRPGQRALYFAGHSLGLRPVQTKEFIQQELDSWEKFAVEGHFKASPPWYSYHETVAPGLARLLGALESEVVAMNTLTTNLHLMLVSFYRPSSRRFKILLERDPFPSDRYAVASQARFHGYSPEEAILEVPRGEDLLQAMERYRDELALVLVGQCNYLSGECFPTKVLSQKAQQWGIPLGLDLAHGIGNLELKLHEWGPDFAVWCSYKYLNSGPGGIAGAFVHQRHHKKSQGQDQDIPRFEGWWGANKKRRFLMEERFRPIVGAEAWQLSNPPIFQLAALRSSLDLFDRAGMGPLRERREVLTSKMEALLREECGEVCDIVTPPSRGAMLSLRFHSPEGPEGPGGPKTPKELVDFLSREGAIVDFREPDIIRLTPAPLYTRDEDLLEIVSLIKDFYDGPS